ncbi:hypothetical protein [Sphingomonas sp.]|uniref:hypothetical protein n=1 Tax=Sphingomonas sp. TaxID=28214 RepID=UPI0025DBEC60|nr:hypothetical protein [Sphingomonas sp.]
MPRGYRSIVFAVVGWLALCGAQRPAEQPGSPSGTQNTVSAPRPAPSESPPYRPYRDRYSDGCYSAQNHDTADLCAQWRAAIAAEKAADEARLATIAAIVGTVLSLITVGGLIVTIWQTNGALGEARRGNRLNLLFERRSRREARKADADQARALGIAERNAQAATAQAAQFSAAQRAWVRLTVKPILVTQPREGSLRFNIEFSAENIGQTPATHFELHYRVLFWKQDEPYEEIRARVNKIIEEWRNEAPMQPTNVLLPADIEIETFDETFNAKELSWWSAPQHPEFCHPILLAAVTYRTINRDDIVQFSWRSWFLQSYADDGTRTPSLSKSERRWEEDRLCTQTYRANLVHEEHPTNDGNDQRADG